MKMEMGSPTIGRLQMWTFIEVRVNCGWKTKDDRTSVDRWETTHCLTMCLFFSLIAKWLAVHLAD